MARVTTQPHTARLYRSRWNNKGTIIESNAVIASDSWNEKITRDDLKISPVNSYGFRHPLPYYAMKTEDKQPAIVSLEGSYLATMPDITARFSLTGLIATSYYNFCSASAVQAVLPASALTRLHVDLLKRVGNQKFSLGQALAEADKSVSMIARSASTLQKALLNASRKNWTGVAKALGVKPKRLGDSGKTTAGGWLEYSFGWEPVVQDLANAALFLGGRFDEDNPPLIFAKGMLTESKTVKAYDSFGLPYGGGGVTVAWKQTTEYREDLRCSLYYKADIGNLRELARYGLVGLSTPWALLPSSYLVDWILPIGDVLAAIDATAGLSFYAGSDTRFRSTTGTRTMTGLTMNGGNPAFNKISGSVDWLPSKVFDMRRSTYASSPLVYPAYIKNPFDPWKAVTSIALLRSRVNV